MGDNNISEKLRALATGSNRSATARLREIFDEIEVALRSGVHRKDVHQLLTENGFQISFASFELALYRIKKKKGIEGVGKKVKAESKPAVAEKNAVVVKKAGEEKAEQVKKGWLGEITTPLEKSNIPDAEL